jgi:ADP-heptose:LPS heptosyltransferase
LLPNCPAARAKDDDWRIRPTPQHRTKAGRLLDSAGFQGHDIIAFAPGSKMQAKKWPRRSF